MPLGRVAVTGRSMLPTLHPGDELLVRWGGRVRPGRLVVARLPGRPLVVKRASVPDAVGWWVESDNPAEGTDSWTLGTPVPYADVLGVVLWRYRPLVRRPSLGFRHARRLRRPFRRRRPRRRAGGG